MKTELDQEKLLAFVRTMIGESQGREDDEHPLPPGPWDPIIRMALERIQVYGPHPEPWNAQRVPRTTIESVFGPSPEPWKIAIASILAKHPEIFDAIGGGRRLGEEVALNPQPLPPRFAFLISAVHAMVSRAQLFQEFTDATKREVEQRGITVAGAYIAKFADDFCGNGFKLKYPFPGPRPHWFTSELDGIDLLVMATQLEQAAKETFSPSLRQNLGDASTKFVEAGLAKMQ